MLTPLLWLTTRGRVRGFGHGSTGTILGGGPETGHAQSQRLKGGRGSVKQASGAGEAGWWGESR